MKKSKINPEEVLEDANKVMDMISNLENINLNNIDAFEKKIINLEKTLQKKYKDQIEENSEEDLDTKK